MPDIEIIFIAACLNGVGIVLIGLLVVMLVLILVAEMARWR